MSRSKATNRSRYYHFSLSRNEALRKSPSFPTLPAHQLKTKTRYLYSLPGLTDHGYLGRVGRPSAGAPKPFPPDDSSRDAKVHLKGIPLTQKEPGSVDPRPGQHRATLGEPRHAPGAEAGSQDAGPGLPRTRAGAERSCRSAGSHSWLAASPLRPARHPGRARAADSPAARPPTPRG